MPAHSVVSPEQMEILVAFMEENRELATGRMNNTGPIAKHAVRVKWEEVAARLNAVGASKPAPKWRDYWNEKKYVVRKKAGLNVHTRGRGKMWPLTPCEERILNIMGKAAVLGSPSVRIPFDDFSDDLSQSQAESPPSADDEFPSAAQTPRLPSPPPPSSPIETGSPSAGNCTTGTSAEQHSRSLQLEERRVAVEEKTAVALAAISAVLTAIQGPRPATKPSPPLRPPQFAKVTVEASTAGTSTGGDAGTKPQSRKVPPLPRRALRLEERRIAAEERRIAAVERMADATAAIASALATIRATLERMEAKM